MKIIIIWYVTPCNLRAEYKFFRETCCRRWRQQLS